MVHSAHSPLYFICLEQLLYIVKSFQAANDKVNRISVPLSSLLSALSNAHTCSSYAFLYGITLTCRNARAELK